MSLWKHMVNFTKLFFKKENSLFYITKCYNIYIATTKGRNNNEKSTNRIKKCFRKSNRNVS